MVGIFLFPTFSAVSSSRDTAKKNTMSVVLRTDAKGRGKRRAAVGRKDCREVLPPPLLLLPPLSAAARDSGSVEQKLFPKM